MGNIARNITVPKAGSAQVSSSVYCCTIRGQPGFQEPLQSSPAVFTTQVFTFTAANNLSEF